MNKFFKALSPNSLRGQLLIWLLGPLMLIGLVAIYDGYQAARSTADAVSDRLLSGSVLAIAERVFVNDNDKLEVDIPYIALQMLTSSEDDRIFYRVEDANGVFLTGYRRLKLPEMQVDLSEVTFHDSIFRGDPIRIATYVGAASSSVQSIGFRVAIAETTNGRRAIAQSILVRSLFRQAILLIAAAFLTWFAITRALRPLYKVEAAVNRRSPEDLRPIEHRVPSEIVGLVSTINALVDRFAASILALQNFTSHASHQLRTPLALIKTHLEIASREVDPVAQKKAFFKAHKAIDDADRLMSQMLLLARIDSASEADLRTRTCDLSQVAREVCEDFVLQFSNEGRLDVDLGFHADEQVKVQADKTLVQEVIRNLIDNAVKHGAKNPKIDVIVQQNGQYGELDVCDNGEGFCLQNDNQAHSIRVLPEGRTKSSSTGLGFSIVNEIAEILDGQIETRRSLSPQRMSVIVKFKVASSQLYS